MTDIAVHDTAGSFRIGEGLIFDAVGNGARQDIHDLNKRMFVLRPVDKLLLFRLVEMGPGRS